MLRRKDCRDIYAFLYQRIEDVLVFVAHYACLVGEKSYPLAFKERDVGVELLIAEGEGPKCRFRLDGCGLRFRI